MFLTNEEAMPVTDGGIVFIINRELTRRTGQKEMAESEVF